MLDDDTCEERERVRAYLLDLCLREGRDESGLDDEGQVGETSLSEDLSVAERERVDDGDKVTRLLGELLLLVRGDKGPH